VDWAGWAVFGIAATVTLTGIMVAAQLAGFSRMDIPLMLGTLFTEQPDRARFLGFLVHLVNGQLFALVYAAAFSLLGRSGWWLGALFGWLGRDHREPADLRPADLLRHRRS
jgi:heme A synthase